MDRRGWLLVLLVLLLVGMAPRAGVASGSFDLVYVDSMTVTLTPWTRGFVLSQYGFAVLVNTSKEELSGADLSAIGFSSVSSLPNAWLRPDCANLSNYAPLSTAQGVGSVQKENAMLLELMGSGEGLRNSAPDQVLAFHFLDMVDAYVGPVEFDIGMTLGDQECRFRIGVDVRLGDNPSVTMLHAKRVSSQSTTPTTPLTWGRLKSLYR